MLQGGDGDIALIHFTILRIDLLQVQVSVQNGAGQFEVAVPPAAGTTFCDGQAHEIIVEKVKAKVTVKIDSLPPKSAERKGASSVDTPDTAFFGGLPGKSSFTSFALFVFFI